MNTDKKTTLSVIIIIIVILAAVLFLFFRAKHTAPAESMPALSQTDDALTAPNGNSQTPGKTTTGTSTSVGAQASTTTTAPAMTPTGMTLISKLGIQIPYPVSDTFNSVPEGNLASATCTKDGVDENTGAKCNYIVPNKGSELITFKGQNDETVNIITSDTSGYNPNACTSMTGTSSPSLNVGGKTIYHTTTGSTEEYCLVTPTYTFTLSRNISTLPEIDVSKILFL